MVARPPRSIASAGVLGALVAAAAVTPHLAPAHSHAALHAQRHVPAAMAPRRMPALVAVVIRGDVSVIQADGRVRRRLTGDHHATSPRLSPTQRQVAYVDTSRSPKGASPYLTTGDVWVVAVRGPRARRLTAAPVADLGTPSWSPDGRRLAFYAGTAIAVCVVATDRCTNVLRSSHGARWDSSAPGIAWSPDGRRIAVALPYTGPSYPRVMRVAIGNVMNGRVTTSTIHFPSGALGRAIPPGSYPSDDGLTWRPDGRGLVFATLGEGAGPPNVTGIWQVADSGGSAHLLIGAPAGVREEGYPAGSPLQPTHFMFSPSGTYLATDPDSRLWVAHADGRQGRFFDLHLARGFVLAQSTWLADNSGLAYVVLCLIPNRNAVTATLYSLTLTGAPPLLLAHVYSANSADQDELQAAPSYRCVACGY